MNRNNIITITDGESYENWGSLTELCKKHKLPYHTLKKEIFPFEYKGVKFEKVPFRALNGVKFT